MITAEELKKLDKDQVLAFIRESLKFDDVLLEQFRRIDQEELKNQHRRFEMSGYDNGTGTTTITNMGILNTFAYLGIYDYTSVLFIDAYKGLITVYYQYWGENCLNSTDDDLSGWGTVEILYRIFELTILSERGKRRRI